MNTLAVLQANGLSVNEYWDNMLLRMVVLEKENFVFTNLGKVKRIPKRAGTKTMSLRRYNHLPVNNADITTHRLTEGVAPDALEVQGVKVQATVNQYGAYLKETDVADDVHFDDITEVYQPELARHASEVKERDVMLSFSEASEYFVGGKANVDAYASTDTDYLTLQDCRIVWLIVKNFRRRGHKKFGGKPVVVVHANVMQDLLDDTTLEKKLLVPGNDNMPIKNGSLERYLAYGIYFQETLIADVTLNAHATNPVNVYTSYLLAEDPYVVTSLGTNNVKFLKTSFKAEKSDPLGQIRTMGYKMWTGAKVIDPIAIQKIYSVSAYDIALSDFNAITGISATDSIGSAAPQV